MWGWILQIAKDFGIHFTTLYDWMKKAISRAGTGPAHHPGRLGELREAAADPAAGAGERSAPQGGGLFVAGQAGKMMYPLVKEWPVTGSPSRLRAGGRSSPGRRTTGGWPIRSPTPSG